LTAGRGHLWLGHDFYYLISNFQNQTLCLLMKMGDNLVNNPLREMAKCGYLL